MNVPEILAVADPIEVQPRATHINDPGFSLGWYKHSCGTPCCIAGFTVGDKCATYVEEEIHDEAVEKLGLTDDQARKLFFGLGPEGIYDPTPKHAAAVLRHLAATGEVDWSIKP